MLWTMFYRTKGFVNLRYIRSGDSRERHSLNNFCYITILIHWRFFEFGRLLIVTTFNLKVVVVQRFTVSGDWPERFATNKEVNSLLGNYLQCFCSRERERLYLLCGLPFDRWTTLTIGLLWLIAAELNDYQTPETRR